MTIFYFGNKTIRSSVSYFFRESSMAFQEGRGRDAKVAMSRGNNNNKTSSLFRHISKEFPSSSSSSLRKSIQCHFKREIVYHSSVL